MFPEISALKPISIQMLIILAFLFALSITLYNIPKVMKKMKFGGMIGKDINKKDKPEIPEMVGIASLFGFSLSLAIVLGIQSLLNLETQEVQLLNYRLPILASIGVFLVAAFVGVIDDISYLSNRAKILYVGLASIPLIAITPSVATLTIPFLHTLDFREPYILYLVFWVIIVPLGITGTANALNMSAGYNGLESGQVAIISFFLVIISYIKSPTNSSSIIFSALLGSSLALFYFNKYPAKIFIGDAGTLGLGAAIGAGVIIGKIEFYGVICILPAFYELFATAYYKIKRIERREKCHNPIITEDNKLKSPKGAEGYTLAYYILGKKPMTEKNLVNTLLLLYFICGVVALTIALVS